MPVIEASSDGLVGEKKTQQATRTSFNNTAASADVQVRDDKGDVRNIQNLCPVGKSHCPELRGRSEDMDESLSCARSNLRPVGYPDEI